MTRHKTSFAGPTRRPYSSTLGIRIERYGSPVAFLEGIYVAAEHRRQGIAARLVDAVAAWATSLGCREFASDAPLENELSQEVHKALGFRETERVVFFRKVLR